MAVSTRSHHMPFEQNPHHLYVFHGESYNLIHSSGGTSTFGATDTPGKVISYDAGTLNRMNGAGMVKVMPFALMPENMREGFTETLDDVFLHDLTPAQQKRVNYRYAMVQAALFLKETEGLKGDDASLTDAMDDICREGVDLLCEDMPNPNFVLAKKLYKEGKGRKPQTKGETLGLEPVSSRTLRGWMAKYKAGGKKALTDKVANRGNRHSIFSAEEHRLRADVVDKEYMTLQRKPIKLVHQDMKRAFKEENERRAEDGFGPLKCPSRETVRLHIKKLDKFRVRIARYGQKEAMKYFRASKTGLESLRPFERVEMDEVKLDLFTIMAKCKFFDLFSMEELEALGLLDKRKRWWLVCAIDCRTRCIVGMTLTADPTSSAALKCLRMVVSDKGQFADAVQAYAPWDIYGTPEVLAVDNGGALKSAAMSNACADLGITKIQTIAGEPSMRGTIERVFHTLNTTLMPRLFGRTFSNVIERSGHPSEERARLTLEDIAFALVRWVVDIYHNTPHEGLMGRTPLEQWEADHEEGNYPLMAAPTEEKKKVVFGLPLKRVVQKSGIRVMNIRYHDPDLHWFFLKHENVEMPVRWFDGDIGAIRVMIDGKWVEIPAVSDVFKGVDAQTWAATRRSLRAKDPKRQEWEEEVVFNAVRAIEEMNASRDIGAKLLDQGWNADRMKAAEAETMASIEIVKTRETSCETADGYGRSVVPHAPERPEIEEAEIYVEDAATSDEETAKTPIKASKTSKKTPAVKPSKPAEDDGSWEFDV